MPSWERMAEISVCMGKVCLCVRYILCNESPSIGLSAKIRKQKAPAVWQELFKTVYKPFYGKQA
jgi:hypothetical protein